MTCKEIREQLVETARGRDLSSDLRAIVFSHAAECADCARRLASERRLTEALSDLGLEAESVPPRLEQIIARRLPVTSIRRPRRRAARVFWPAAGIAAAAAGLGLFLWHGMSAPPVARTVASGNAAVYPKPHPAEAAGSVDSKWADFIPLPYAEEVRPEEATEIVRVQLPRESLASMGLPMSGDEWGEPVNADVLIGMDGTARAIRLLE